MPAVNLRQLDLNLLVVFDAVMLDRSVTRVATRLGMTQSSVSHALARLRAALEDELFVRTPGGMIPTPFALNLAAPVRQALDTIETAVGDSRAFDPVQARRSFVVSVNNQTAVSLVPSLVRAIMHAPHIALDLRPSGTLDIAERLDTGAIDIAVGGFVATAERFEACWLYDDDFAVLCRAAHPAAGAGAIGVEALAGFPHLILSSTGEDSHFIDEELARRGWKRRVAVHAPLLAATNLLAGSDMLAVVARRTATAIVRHAAMVALDLPFATPPLTTTMLWHRRWTNDGAHRWLRDLILAAAQGDGPQYPDASGPK